MRLTFDVTTRELIVSALESAINRCKSIGQTLSNYLEGVAQPEELVQYQARAMALTDAMNAIPRSAKTQIDVDTSQVGLLRATLSSLRRERAERVEAAHRSITHPASTRALDASLGPLNELLSGPGLARIVPDPVPSLADFLAPEARRQHHAIPSFSGETRDPKLNILLSASLISPDIGIYRQHCEERRLPFAVVFADLDDFKNVNSLLGEVEVDRRILPRILGAIENASYGHGRAYRHGGDEVVLLFPNAQADVIASLVLQMKDAVERIAFDGIDFRPRVSAGVWVTVAGVGSLNSVTVFL